MERVFVQNFGCRASQSDGAALESALERRGFEAAAGPATADWVVLNTCSVTASADDDVRQTVRRVKRENPNTRVVVTGCYAQRAPQEVASLPGVELVVGNTHKLDLPSLLAERVAGGAGLTGFNGLVQLGPSPAPYHAQIHVGDIFAAQSFLSSPVEDAAGDRSRPNLKVQDGCNNRCSFCIIPFLRGRSRSLPADEVVAQVRTLADAGYPEVVLSGINLGRWGREHGFEHDGRALRLAGLVRRILGETPIPFIRLSSVEPMDFSDELIDLMGSNPRIARHVHAPLQSGSDSVLRRMHRKYRPRHYEDRIRKAHQAMPDAAIGADVMVGFPGETDDEFEASRAFIENLPFTYLHVFTYSERPGTPAAEHPDPVPVPVRKERNRVLRDLAARKGTAFRERMLGRTLQAVTLDGGQSALSTNYLKIRLQERVPARQLIDVWICGVESGGLVGTSAGGSTSSQEVSS